jgi:hypothetical protein
MLDKFIKNLTRCPYLFESEEFKVFLHPNQDIEKQLEFLQPKKTINPNKTIKRYNKYFHLGGTFSERQQHLC